MKNFYITFIGAGEIARSIISGLIKKKYPRELIASCAPSSINRNKLSKSYGIQNSSDNIFFAKKSNILILAIKPQVIVEVCKPLKKKLNFSNKLIISTVAGVTLNRLYLLLGKNVSIIRIMPNLSCLTGKGTIGMYIPNNIDEKYKLFSYKLMNKIGKVFLLNKEEDINNIIAASSSAISYFFLLMEAMQKHMQTLGFNEKISKEIILQTLIGTSALAKKEINISFKEIIKNISSEAGTTASAIKVFKNYNFSKIVSHAMNAAITRAEEMEKLF